MGGEAGNDGVAIAVCLAAEHGNELRAQLGEALGLLFAVAFAEGGHALHEEFVEIRGEDGEELGAFEEGCTLVERFGEDAFVEIEPAEITVDPDLRKLGGKLFVENAVVADGCKDSGGSFDGSHDEFLGSGERVWVRSGFGAVVEFVAACGCCGLSQQVCNVFDLFGELIETP